MNHRMDRVCELMKREVGEAVRRLLPVAEAGVVSVYEVHVAKDLKVAHVYVSILGNKMQQERGFQLLQDHRREIQQRMAQNIVLKYTPQLQFVLDNSIARGNRVLAIMDELDKAKPSTPS